MGRPESEEPQYDLRGGLAPVITTNGVSRSEFIPPSELSMPKTAQAVEPIRVVKGAHGDTIECQFVNQHAPDGGLEVIYLHWHSAITDPAMRLLILALAASGRRRLIVSGPGMGQSDPMPRTVAQHISQTGSFVPMAEWSARLIEKIANDYDDIRFSGTSEGARRALGMAAIWRKAVEMVYTDDAPGSRRMRMGAVGLALAFGREVGHNKKFVAAATDPLLIEAQLQQDSLRRFGHSLRRQRRLGNVVNMVWHETTAMTRDGLQADALMAIQNGLRTLVLGVPTHSELNHPADVLAIADTVAEAARDSQRVATIEYPGTHASGAANMPLTARLYDLAREV